MPRNGSGVYNLPPGTPGVPDTPVESAPYNIFIADIENDLNTPRPIVAGGTGASTPSAALANLGGYPKTGGELTGDVEIKKDTPVLMLNATAAGQQRYVTGLLDDKQRWAVILGDSAAEGGSNAGSNFAVARFADGGSLIGLPFTLNRADGNAAFTGNITTNGKVTLASPGSATVELKKAASGQFNNVIGYTDTVPRWQIQLGNVDAESSGELGSNFSIDRFNDSGVYIDSPLAINRATGDAVFSHPVKAVGAPYQNYSLHPNSVMATFGSIFQLGLNQYVDSTGGTWRNLFDGYSAAIVMQPTNGFLEFYSTLGAVTTGNPVSGHTRQMYIDTAGGVHSTGSMFPASSPTGDNFALYFDGNYNIRFNPGYYIYSNASQMMFTFQGGYWMLLHSGGSFQVNVPAYKPGGGAWLDNSDARIKNVLGDYTRGLDDIAALNPKTFTFKGNDTVSTLGSMKQGAAPGEEPQPESKDTTVVPYPESPHYHAAVEGKRFAGLIAQDVEAVFPEMITKRSGYINGVAVSDLRDLDTTPLIFALINAVKELAARVEQLEFDSGG